MSRAFIEAAVFAISSSSAAASTESLSAVRWERRIIVLFAEANEAQLVQQLDSLLQDGDGLEERKLLILAVVGDEVNELYGPPLSGLEARTLRREFSVERWTPFVALLIGKDGGIKLRSQRPIDRRELFSIIDAMPMRRSGDEFSRNPKKPY